MIGNLGELHPDQAEELVAMLQRCALAVVVCTPALSITASLKISGWIPAQIEAINYWLSFCVACGICEEACLQHLPLTAIFSHIGQAALVT